MSCIFCEKESGETHSFVLLSTFYLWDSKDISVVYTYFVTSFTS